MRTNRCRLCRGDAASGTCDWCAAPLPAGHRRWCSTACSDAYRDSHVWAFARARALADADYRCSRCGDTGDLHCHHDPPLRGHGRGAQGCWNHQDRLEVLCPDCHVLAHRVMAARPGAQLELFRAA